MKTKMEDVVFLKYLNAVKENTERDIDVKQRLNDKVKW